ncbi:MAG: phospholipase D family protein [Desulfohalobiaceae bacterium]
MPKKQMQLPLPAQESYEPQTLYLQKPKDFEQLISGFSRLKAVSYVATPSLVLDIFEKYGFQQMQLLVGEEISVQHYKAHLEKKQVSLIQRLMHLVQEGKLTVFFPKNKTIHSKLYLLHHEDNHRVIVGSANLSGTASRAQKQHNYVVYWDLQDGDPLLERFFRDYQAHLKNSRIFLDDLLQLLKTKDEPEEKIIRTWLSQDVGEVKDIVESEASRILTDLTRQALQAADDQQDSPQEEQAQELQAEGEEIRVIVPSDARTRERIEKTLQPLSPSIVNSELRLSAKDFSEHVKKSCGIPVMGIDKPSRKVFLHLGDHRDVLSRPVREKEELNQGLAYIEDYIESYRFGESMDLQRIQMNVFEALLYVLSSPFAHEFKKLAKQVDMYSRGPSYLYLYGPSFNGKTNFLRFGLKLITGRHIEPIAQEYFNKTRIMNARTFGTVFPLMFDDVNIGSNQTMETVLKNYWEVWWRPEHPVPQIILTTNRINPPEWANTRIKRINFDIKFDQKNIKARETLNRILNTDCDLFRIFAHNYLELLDQPVQEIKDSLLGDELSLARKVFRDLYRYAERELPAYFPQEPVENIYDIDKMEWLELFETGVLSQEEQAHKIFVFADKNMHTYEVARYASLLPQGVKAKRKGHTIIVEGKEKYLEWIQTGRKKHGLFKRLWHSLGKSKGLTASG